MPTRLPLAAPPFPTGSPYHRRPPNQKLYGYQWEQRAKAFLLRYRLCGDRPNGQPAVGSACADRRAENPHAGVQAARVVDHVIAHRGDPARFWDEQKNWQALCKRCHDQKTRRENR